MLKYHKFCDIASLIGTQDTLALQLAVEYLANQTAQAMNKRCVRVTLSRLMSHEATGNILVANELYEAGLFLQSQLSVR